VNLEWVLDRARASVVQHGANMVVIDPWNEMDHSRPRDMSLTEYTGCAIKEFKRLARSMNIHLIVAAHPAKQQRREDGTFQIPSLYDVSDSAHWYNKPEVGIVVHREPRTGPSSASPSLAITTRSGHPATSTSHSAPRPTITPCWRTSIDFRNPPQAKG
jgi:twinkle protein